ncbi:nuclear transport factor 2 family protein [Acidovorax sp. FG27]|uniref:YybH family protein n=1 Tax=Acidovorax sp. FG27 TaxID=3133652 RepID=UPI0030EA7369
MANNAFIQARKAWYAAYVAGDVDRLAELESPDLVVISPEGMEKQHLRLPTIAASVAAGRWFPEGSSAEDIESTILPITPDVMSVHGLGRISTPSGHTGRIHFTELWRQEATRWRVVHLHYHGQKK